MLTGLDLRERIEARLAELPIGYISEKNIRGKKQYYLQWREEGKLKSKYIRVGEVEFIRRQIEERKELEKRFSDEQSPTLITSTFASRNFLYTFAVLSTASSIVNGT